MPSKPKIALATVQVLPEPDPDQDLLLAALERAGCEPRLHPWDAEDSVRTLRDIDLCVLRSTWNYHLHLERFGVWLRSVQAATRILNPLPAIEWNLHKRYLLELEESGVPVIPTRFASVGSEPSLEALLAETGWSEFVVKPAVSAASWRTRRFGADELDEAQTFLDGLVQERDAMVQRYMPSVEAAGEVCLVRIGERFTHAIEKRPRFEDGVESVSDGRDGTQAECELAERALACLGSRGAGLAYARVDMIPGDDGRPMVSELELIEPSLFLAQSPHALESFAELLGERALEVRAGEA